MKRWLSIALLLFAIGELQSSVVADDKPIPFSRRPSFADSAFKVQVHKAEQGIPFPSPEKNQIVYGTVYVPQGQVATAPAETERKTEFGYLPNCGASAVRQTQVFERTEEAQAFDYLFYADADPGQKAMVASAPAKTTAIPYFNSTKIVDPMLLTSQRLALSLNIQCLPTRFRFVLVDGKNFLEYREGSEAWK